MSGAPPFGGIPFCGIPSSQVSLAGFQTFVTNVMGVPSVQLPATTPILLYAYNTAVNMTNRALAYIWAQPGSWTPYAQAVYNLGGHLLIEFAQDQSYQITSATWLFGVVTAATAAPNVLSVQDQVIISGISPLPYCTPLGQQTTIWAVQNPTTFQYTLAVDSTVITNPGPATVAPNAAVTEWYWSKFRQMFNITGFAPGVITSASDLTTSAGILNQQFFQGLTMGDLQLLKTPYGRNYLAIAQNYGTIWGLT